ncbi:hypothetical protein [Flavobacterium sp. HTF]|uniref:hypothetical protein n=1 Tax=Flavobacterium sp. HTF TaxID=2170732 RepID=UPI000D5DC3AF|nr:hypothetical protein [Flavobacterium sp. HTF]PWB19399.1 hypothetical protein DCO46_21615 [Flavobacterium sp. HTF]
MKNYVSLFVIIECIFSFSCFGQGSDLVIANSKIKHKQPKSDKTVDKDLVIESYLVEETINMTFGNRTTTYEVTKLNMVNTYDLGPNNTRTVTPLYAKPKEKVVASIMQSKTIVDTIKTEIKPVKLNVAAPEKKEKYVTINLLNTYEKVLDRGYKSVDMLKKVADKSYFENDMVTAAKYYAQLLEISTDLEASYYYRYAQSLKAINETEKAQEAMLLFESKNIGNDVVKHTKLNRN